MKFKNAYNGVSKLFTAEVMMLLSTVALIVAGIVLAVAAAMQADAVAVGSMIALGIFGIAALVLSVVAFVLNFVGLIQANKDEASFSVALIATVVGIIASILMGVFSANTLVSGLMDTFTKIASLATTLFVVQGIVKLANRLGNQKMIQKGHTIFYLILTVQIIGIVARFIAALFGGNAALALVAAVLAITAQVINLVAYFIYLAYLGRAKKMLA